MMVFEVYESPLTERDKALVALAEKTISRVYRRDGMIHHTLGSALISQQNVVYTGVNMEVQSCAPASNCAEKAAIYHLVEKEGEAHIDTIATHKINNGNSRVVAPCGQCVEIIGHFGNPYLIVTRQEDGELCKVRLEDFVRSRYVTR